MIYLTWVKNMETFILFNGILLTTLISVIILKVYEIKKEWKQINRIN
jgi:hypothetical protein